MKNLIGEYIKKFISSEKKISFNLFLKYLYYAFEEKIKNKKNKLLKNKYIKMRKGILQYIVYNKKLIVNQINQELKNK